MPASSPNTSARQALEHLADAFDEHDFSITLTAPEEHPPRLSISNRHCPLTEDVFSDGRLYCWSWGQPIAAVGNPSAAAGKISYVLGGPGDPHA